MWVRVAHVSTCLPGLAWGALPQQPLARLNRSLCCWCRARSQVYFSLPLSLNCTPVREARKLHAPRRSRIQAHHVTGAALERRPCGAGCAVLVRFAAGVRRSSRRRTARALRRQSSSCWRLAGGWATRGARCGATARGCGRWRRRGRRRGWPCSTAPTASTTTSTTRIALTSRTQSLPPPRWSSGRRGPQSRTPAEAARQRMGSGAAGAGLRWWRRARVRGSAAGRAAVRHPHSRT